MEQHPYYRINGSTLNQCPTNLPPNYDIPPSYFSRHNDFGGQIYESKFLPYSQTCSVPYESSRLSQFWNFSSYHSNYPLQYQLTGSKTIYERTDDFIPHTGSELPEQYTSSTNYSSTEFHKDESNISAREEVERGPSHLSSDHTADTAEPNAISGEPMSPDAGKSEVVDIGSLLLIFVTRQYIKVVGNMRPINKQNMYM